MADNRVQVGFRLSKDGVAQIDKLRVKPQITRTDVIRALLGEALQDNSLVTRVRARLGKESL